jgi:hypothetical protein
MATKRKRKPLVQQPTTVAGAGVSLTSFVTFLPPHWQPYGYALAGILGLLVPVAAALAQRE